MGKSIIDRANEIQPQRQNASLFSSGVGGSFFEKQGNHRVVGRRNTFNRPVQTAQVQLVLGGPPSVRTSDRYLTDGKHRPVASGLDRDVIQSGLQ